MNDQQRERAAFEAYARSLDNNDEMDFSIQNGFYVDDYLQADWELWQAARASQPVDVLAERQNDGFDVCFEALGFGKEHGRERSWSALVLAINERTGQPAQEPVAKIDVREGDIHCMYWFTPLQQIPVGTKLYTTPQPAAVGVPDKEQIEALARSIATEVAANCGTVPQLTFPHIYLGLLEFFAAPQPPAVPDGIDFEAKTVAEAYLQQEYKNLQAITTKALNLAKCIDNPDRIIAKAFELEREMLAAAPKPENKP